LLLSRLFKNISKLLSGYGLGRNRVIASIYFNVAKKLLPEYILFRGNKIHLDSENSIQLAIFGYHTEEYELSVFESQIKSNSVVLDIGANIGIYTLVAARHAQKVYSFEPDPANFLNLSKNIESNHYEDVVVKFNKAVSDKTGQAKFSSSSKKTARGGFHLISKEESLNQECLIVETVALDDFFSDRPNKVDIIKMDIEGSEFEALKGMKNLINANKKVRLFLEFNPYALNRAGAGIVSLLDYLFSLGFELHRLDEIDKSNKPVNKEWLVEFAKNKDKGRYINLLGVKNLE
jgi:FkbM family methyltransferase